MQIGLVLPELGAQAGDECVGGELGFDVLIECLPAVQDRLDAPQQALSRRATREVRRLFRHVG